MDVVLILILDWILLTLLLSIKSYGSYMLNH